MAAALTMSAALIGIDGVAATGGGPEAVAAKKKCKAKCLKAKATNFLKGHSFTRVSYSAATGASSTERTDLCTNGTLHFRGDYVGYSGTAWVDTYDGTWRVSSAGKTSAQVAVTTSNFQSSYGDPPPPAAGTVAVQALSATKVLIGGAEYSRGAGAC